MHITRTIRLAAAAGVIVAATAACQPLPFEASLDDAPPETTCPAGTPLAGQPPEAGPDGDCWPDAGLNPDGTCPAGTDLAGQPPEPGIDGDCWTTGERPLLPSELIARW